MKYNFLVALLVVLGAAPTHAQLTLEQAISPKKAEQYVRAVPRSELDAYLLKHGAPYSYEDGRTSNVGLTAATSHTEYAWRFDGKEVFYSYVKAFRSDITPPPACSVDAPADKALRDSECVKSIVNFAECHLFVFDSNRKLVAVQPLNIPQPDYLVAKPSCFDVHAMAPAKVVKNGMLIVASYYDSRWTCMAGQECASDNPAALPDPLYKTAFLVRFNKDANGKLILTQDDHCLKPLNNYSTIVRARKALEEMKCN
ncbi:hypothetical protein GCM10007860_00940 [Chitiniphilus shinanonensis]|uniref:Secreted protein n=1 Tax=Chitiniphilus shinanonensis TaxID=553088 RepID=A0ABQ6BR16_9NEIS|nr:hypothetical protein [Chitiniphilus shinanonensis]GLS02951.1 hypothetical protein GCM10007860_00940 [Chitiniphilus shinanonensis]